MKWEEVNEVSIRYELRGCGQELIVLIHEAGGSIESWDQVTALFEDKYQVLRYDQRGFGMSECTSEITLNSMVNDLSALLNTLNMTAKPAHIVGTAIGGTIALGFAARHPDRTASVVVTSPVTGGIPENAKAALNARADTVEREGMRSVADASLNRSYPQEFRANADKFLQYRRRLLANDPQSFAALSRSFTTIDLADLYSEIQCPVLVVGCTKDDIKHPRECAEIASMMPKGQYVEVESGHFIAILTPDKFVSVVTTFLESYHINA